MLAAIGYGWRRAGMAFEREFVTRLAMNVAGPCLVVDTLSNLSIPATEFIGMVGASAVLLLSTILVAWLIVLAARRPQRVYLPVLGIGNTGNLGLPLCLFAFGTEGLGFAVAVFVTNSVLQFVFTPTVQSGASPLKALYTTPVVYGAAIGLLLMLTGTRLPMPVATTVELLGNVLIPLMLLALGNTLAGLEVRHVGPAFIWGAGRLALGFTVAHLIAWAFAFEGVAKGVIILQGSMPAAVFTYLFAARYDRSPEVVASIVLSSTVLSALTLPLLVAYVLGF